MCSTNIYDDNFYVYVYLDPITREPFYVGKGSGRRAYDHIRNARVTTKNHPNLNKIRKILKEGHSPIIIFPYSSISEERAFVYEMSLISHYGRRDVGGGPLMNLTDGGEGLSGCVKNSLPKDKNVYELINISTKEIRSVLQSEMVNEIGMSSSTASMLVNEKIISSSGWCLLSKYSDSNDYYRKGENFKFVNAYTKEEIICTQSELCKMFKLSYGNVCSLTKGERNHTGGWCVDEVPPDFKYTDANKKYKFVHKDGEVRELTVKEFKEQIKNSSKVHALISGVRNSAYGWSLLKEEE